MLEIQRAKAPLPIGLHIIEDRRHGPADSLAYLGIGVVV